MNSLKENIAIGLLVALAIGPSLSADPSLALAVRLSSTALVATGTIGRWAHPLGLRAFGALSSSISGSPKSALGKEASSS
jgi:hypothetical protein